MKAMAALACALALAAPGGATTKVAPAPAPPPYAGVYQPQGVDEIGIWREDDEGERALATSPMVIHDEALTRYLKGVLCSVVGQDRCGATRLYVLRTPVFNATMSPNGTLRVFSGLLLRVRSEAELGAVLGHEFGHFERRHSLSGFKAERRGTDMVSWALILASLSNSPHAGSDFRSLQMSVYGSLSRFNRDNEREADMLGIGYLNRSAYRPQAAAMVWRNFIAEAEASAAARGLKKPRFDRIAFFASHPPEAERAGYLAALAMPEGETRDDGAARYAAAMAPWLPVFLDDQIKLNDFGGSEYVIDALAAHGWTPALWQARGELYRTRGAQRDLVNAADFYARAIAAQPMLAEAHRGLGLSLVKTGRAGEGRAALQRYLELKPDAPDAAMIRMTASSIGAN